MSIFKSLVSLVRGSATEVGEAIVDANSGRILDQNLRDYDEKIKKSKVAVARLSAKTKSLQREEAAFIEKRNAAIKNGRALEASGDTEKAREMALLIQTEIMEPLSNVQSALAENIASVTQLKKIIKADETKYRRYEHEISMEKTRKVVSKARMEASNSALSSNSTGAQIESTLSRSKSKTTEQMDMLDSLDEIDSTKSQLDSLMEESTRSAESSKSTSDLFDSFETK